MNPPTERRIRRVESRVLLFQIAPHGTALLHGEGIADHQQMDEDTASMMERNRSRYRSSLRLFTVERSTQSMMILGDLELLVDALHHDAFIDRLTLPSDEVVIEVQIQIAQLLHIGKGLIGQTILST